MKRIVIKNIIEVIINTSAIVIAYKLGEAKGYEDGFNDAEAEGGCEGCSYNYKEESGCPDISDFENIIDRE